MAENLTDEIKQLNENATLLLQKYDGVFSKLSEESQKILTAMAGKSEEGLTAIQELLNTGNVAQAENALKLGGKSLQNIIDMTKVVNVQIATHEQNVTLARVPSHTFWSFDVQKKYDDSKSFLMIQALLPGQQDHSDVCGIRCDVNGVGVEAHGSAYKGIWYAGGNSENEGFILNINKKLEGGVIGNNTVNIGWTNRTNVGDQAPFLYWNPDDNKDARSYQSGSSAIIWEILK